MANYSSTSTSTATSNSRKDSWLSILRRNNALTTDNLRRALNQCKDPLDTAEIQHELDKRVEAKAKASKPTPAPSADLPPILQLLVSRMPQRPYFADSLEHGTKIRPKDEAIRHKEVQLNLPWARQCLVLDLDHGETLDGRLPPPNVAVSNPATGHRHAILVWKTPVLVGPSASQRAQQYYQDLAVAVGQCWNADPHYTGTLTHNPMHRHWQTEVLHPDPYGLADFKEALQIVRSMPANHPRLKGSEWADSYAAEGRNCRTWEACRWPAYSMGQTATVEAVMQLVKGYNAMHNTPAMGYRECLNIAKSISRYVLSGKRKGHSMANEDWAAYVNHTHRPEVQSERGKRSGMARRAASAEQRAQAALMRAQDVSVRAIAEALGVSRRTATYWLSAKQ